MINQDEYEDFVTWKHRLKQSNSDEFFVDERLNRQSYKRWKYQNNLVAYDENVLIKTYALEKKLRRLESALIDIMEGE